MEKKTSRKTESSENETDEADQSSDPTREAVNNQSKGTNSPISNVGDVNRSESAKVSVVGRQSSEKTGGSYSSSGKYVNYERHSDPRALSARYGMNVRETEAAKIQRFERVFGRDQVSRWADEGMTVDTMGKPRDMQAFRKRQEERPDEVPTDIERRNEASMQRNANGGRDDGPAGETGVPDVVRNVISSPGRSMDQAVQREMESKMGGDFSDVQLHTGPKAAAAADSINARAFTVGNHVAFNKGEYQPKSTDGKKILAHELTHVRQQNRGRVSLLLKTATGGHPSGSPGHDFHAQPKLKLSSPDDPAEKEAEEVADQVIEMEEPDSPDNSSDNEAAFRSRQKSGSARSTENSHAPDPEGGLRDGRAHLHKNTVPGKVSPGMQVRSVSRQIQRKEDDSDWDDLVTDLAAVLRVYYSKAATAVDNVQGQFNAGGGGGPSVGEIVIGAVIGALGVAGAIAGSTGAIVAASAAFTAGLGKDVAEAALGGGGSVQSAQFFENLRTEFDGLSDVMEGDADAIRTTLNSNKVVSGIFDPLLNETVDKKKASEEISRLHKMVVTNNEVITEDWERSIISGWLASEDKNLGYVFYEHYEPSWVFGEQPQIPGLKLPEKAKRALKSNWGSSADVTALGIPVRVDLYHSRTFPSAAQRGGQSRGPSIESRGPPGSGRTWTRLEKQPGKEWEVVNSGYRGEEYEKQVAQGYPVYAPIPTVGDLDLVGNMLDMKWP
jgi:hypothetical protein